MMVAMSMEVCWSGLPTASWRFLKEVFRGINVIPSNKCLAGVKTQIKKLVICDFAFWGVLKQLVYCFLEALGGRMV